MSIRVSLTEALRIVRDVSRIHGRILELTTKKHLLLQRQFHKVFHFVIQIFLMKHSEMMVKLLASRNLGHFLKAQIIMERLIERKNHMNKVLAQLRNPCNPFLPVINGDHRFSGVKGNRSQRFEFSHEMFKQTQGVF